MPITTPCQDDRYIIALYSEDEDGAVTDRINLADGASYAVGPGAVYAPPPKQKVSRGADSIYRHGSDVVRARYSNSAVEIRELSIMGTPEILAERVMRLTTMLEKARLRQERGWGERVFIERDWRYSTYYAWDVDPGPEYFYETVDVLKKEVFRGEFVPPREDVGGILRDGVLAPCRLNLECYPFWQGRERNVVFEYTVDNYVCEVYPPGERNYINVDGGDLPGDAPCLLRVRAENISPSGVIRNLRMGIKKQCWPLTSPCCDDLVYQTEDADVFGTDTVPHIGDPDFACDAGARVTPSNANNVLRLTWAIGQDLLPQGTYKPFLRIRNGTVARTVLAQFRLLDAPSGADAYVGPQVDIPVIGAGATGFVMLDMGLVTVPPGLVGDWYTPGGYILDIWTESDAGAGTVDIDYLLLLPVEGGLKLEQFATSTAGNGAYFTVGTVWEADGFANPPKIAMYYPALMIWVGRPIDDLGFAAYLEPGFDHCFVFSVDEWVAAGVDKPYNVLTSLLKVTMDIIPQYMYIR